MKSFNIFPKLCDIIFISAENKLWILKTNMKNCHKTFIQRRKAEPSREMFVWLSIIFDIGNMKLYKAGLYYSRDKLCRHTQVRYKDCALFYILLVYFFGVLLRPSLVKYKITHWWSHKVLWSSGGGGGEWWSWVIDWWLF